MTEIEKIKAELESLRTANAQLEKERDEARECSRGRKACDVIIDQLEADKEKLRRSNLTLSAGEIELRNSIKKIESIVEEAFWDHHTAGTMPGAGYNHKVYREVSKVFGWRNSEKFYEWKKSISSPPSDLAKAVEELLVSVKEDIANLNESCRYNRPHLASVSVVERIEKLLGREG